MRYSLLAALVATQSSALSVHPVGHPWEAIVAIGRVSDHLQQLESRDDLATSPPVYPSPWMNPQAVGWEEAYEKAKDFVSQLTLMEKVNLTTGVGSVNYIRRILKRAMSDQFTVGKENNALVRSAPFLDSASAVYACKTLR